MKSLVVALLFVVFAQVFSPKQMKTSCLNYFAYQTFKNLIDVTDVGARERSF